MKKFFAAAAVAVSLIAASPAFAQDVIMPGDAGFVLPAACAPAAVNAAGSAAGCLALFPGMTAAQANALRAAVAAANGGQQLDLLVAALREVGLAAGGPVSP